MKCFDCGKDTRTPMYTLSRTSVDGTLVIVNICSDCVERVLGPAALRKLRRVLMSYGYIQHSMTAP